MSAFGAPNSANTALMFMVGSTAAVSATGRSPSQSVAATVRRFGSCGPVRFTTHTVGVPSFVSSTRKPSASSPILVVSISAVLTPLKLKATAGDAALVATSRCTQTRPLSVLCATTECPWNRLPSEEW